MILLALLPLSGLVVVFLSLYTCPGEQGSISKLRVAFLNTVLLVGGYCVLVTEILSAFSAISFGYILISWCLLLIAPLLYLISRKNLYAVPGEAWSVATKTFKSSPIIWAIFAFLLISLGIGIIYPSNNYDSMTYHMARVAHWQQNQSISHYSTHIIRQLNSPPFAEWIILHLQILTGGDRLANSVQLFFFAGSIINISLITKELGGNSKAQLLSALFTCLIPMAVLQSNTTQNDIIIGFFVTAFAYYTIRIYRKVTLPSILLAGIALGLSLLTKGTGAIYTVLFCCWFFVLLIKNVRLPLLSIIKQASMFAIVLLLAILINAGHFYRNSFLTGSYLGNASVGTANESFETRSLLLVGIKNFFTHLPANEKIKHAIHKTANNLGIDADNPKYSMMPMTWMSTKFSFHEDYAQNFVHTIVIVLAVLTFFFSKRSYERSPNPYLLFVCTICATGILYCVALKWQPWANRLQTSLFFLFSAFLGIQVAAARKWVKVVCIAAMLGFAIPSLLLSEKHPLLAVKESIFKKSYNSFIYEEGQLQCKTYLDTKPYTRLGVFIGADSWDYPYYKLLSKSPNGNRTIKHLFVTNESAIYLDDFIPDAIISLEGRREKYELHGVTYYRTHIFGNNPSLFERKDAGQVSR